MKKLAMNLYDSYRQPLDRNGQPLYKDTHGRWVNREGVPVDNDGQPLRRVTDQRTGDREKWVDRNGTAVNLKSVDPVKKIVNRPVLTEDDLKRSDPVLEKVFPLEKYRKIVDALRRAVKNSRAGIVNFIIGRETELADAILKYAFPPGSGVTYKGVDGYSINTASWGNPDAARAKLSELINGRKRPFDKATIKMIKSLVSSGKIPGLAAIYDPRAAGAAAVAAASGAIGGGTAATPGVRTRRPAGQPAQPAGQPAAPAGQSPLANLEQTLANIEALNEDLERVRREMALLDRYSDEPRTWTEGSEQKKDDAPQRMKYRLLQNSEAVYLDTISTLERSLPFYRDWTGRADYDDSGFMKFKVESRALNDRLGALLNPAKVWAATQASPQMSQQTRRLSDDEMKKRSYMRVVASVVEMLQDLRKASIPEVVAEIDKVLNLLSAPYESIITSFAALKSAAIQMFTQMRQQQRVMILNNLDASALVQQARGIPGAQHGQQFIADDILSESYVSKRARAGRCVIAVSREQIAFGFDGTLSVDLREFPVDDKEAEALIGYAKRIYRKRVENKGGDISRIRISQSDVRKLTMLLSGQQQAQALQLLDEAFDATFNGQEMSLDGHALVEAATKINNKVVKEGAKGDGERGGVRGCYYQKPQITMDDYIRDDKDDWGTYVNAVVSKIETASERQKYADNLRQELEEMKDRAADPAELDAKQKEIDAVEAQVLKKMRQIDRFMILFGSPGCGKSAFPEAMAEKLGFDLLDVDLGQTRGSLVGQTETWSKALIESWKRMSNVVIRIDEMDGQVASSTQEAHESYNANVIKNLLSFFQTERETLIKRNVFVIGTTNNPDRIRQALVDRAVFMHVPEPFTPKAYEKVIRGLTTTMRKAYEGGLLYDPAEKALGEDAWAQTDAIMHGVIPPKGNNKQVQDIAAALVPTCMNFRKLTEFFNKMFSAHQAYVDSVYKKNLFDNNRDEFKRQFPNSWWRDEDGDHFRPVMIMGFPFTAENILKAAKKTFPTDVRQRRITPAQRRAGAEGDVHLGVIDLEKEYYQMYNGIKEDKGQDDGQLSLGIEPAAAFAEDDLLRPADDATVASTDYYLSALTKAGVVKGGAVVDRSVRTAYRLPRNYRPVRGNVFKADAGESGFYECDGISIMPVPGTPTLYRRALERMREERRRETAKERIMSPAEGAPQARG